MKTYIGCKVIEAEPQFEFPDRTLPNGEDPLHERGRPGYAVVYEGGYRSWSPKDVFEAAYHEVPADQAPDALNRATTAIVRPGLSTLDPDQATLIAKGRVVQGGINTSIDLLRATGAADPRALALAQTNFDQAFMWFTAAIAKPERPVDG